VVARVREKLKSRIAAMRQSEEVPGFAVALTTLISGSIFTMLYIRYRDVSFLILAHVLTDLYGLVNMPVDRP
jgi:membrane protease YdiL (CAAX protease family)